MDVAERIRALRTVNGLSVRQLAALAEVSPSTVTRIENRQLSPTTEVAGALFATLGVTFIDRPVSDPTASAAARLAADPGYTGLAPEGVAKLLSSWCRIGLVGDRAVAEGKLPDLLFRAGRLDRPDFRTGSRAYLPAGSWAEVAERFYQDDQLDWALTGGAAANQRVGVGGDQPAIFYVSDVERAAGVAGLAEAPAGYLGERVTLIRFNAIYESGATIEPDGLRLADRLQVAIDCYGGPLSGPTQADALLGVWK